MHVKTIRHIGRIGKIGAIAEGVFDAGALPHLGTPHAYQLSSAQVRDVQRALVAFFDGTPVRDPNGGGEFNYGAEHVTGTVDASTQTATWLYQRWTNAASGSRVLKEDGVPGPATYASIMGAKPAPAPAPAPIAPVAPPAPPPAPDAPSSGLSKGAKLAIISGGVLVVGAATALVVHRKHPAVQHVLRANPRGRGRRVHRGLVCAPEE